MAFTQFSTDDCLKIVERRCGTTNFELLSTSIKPFSNQKIGYSAEHLRAIFTISLNGEKKTLQFFIKSHVEAINIMAKFTLETGAFLKEVFCYEQIIGNGPSKTWAPNLNLCDTKARLIISDDASVDGYVPSKIAIEEIDEEYCKIILKSLAAFHAHSISIEQKKSKELGRAFFFGTEYPERFAEDILFGRHELSEKISESILAAVKNLIKLMPPSDCLSPDEFIIKFVSTYEEFRTLVGQSAKYRNVVCHGDLWLNNLLFKYDNDQLENCMLVDFQTIRYCPPSHDVLTFMFVNTTSEFRQAHMETLLHFYHDQLASQFKYHDLDPEEILPWEDFEASFPEQTLVAKIISLVYKMILFAGPKLFSQMSESEDALYDVMFGDRSKYIVPLYNEDAAYRHRINELLVDIRSAILEKRLSKEDVQNILRKKLQSDQFTLEKFELVPISEKRLGFLGDHNLLKTWVSFLDCRSQYNFFVKTVPTVPEQLLLSTATDCFKKEIFVYSVLNDQMNKLKMQHIDDVTAKIYMTRKDFCLVFENLLEKNYHALDRFRKLEYNEIKIVIKTMAKFHSASFIYEELMTRKIGSIFRIGNHYGEYTKNYGDHPVLVSRMMGTRNGLLLEVDLLISKDHYDIEMIKKKINIICDNYFKYVIPSTKFRNVVNHSDLWASNIMMRYSDQGEPLHARLVDFQGIRYAPPTNDLMAFIYLTTTRECRDLHMADILNQYYKCLGNELEQYSIDVQLILPQEDFLQSCEEMKLFGATQAAIFDQYLMMRDDFFTELYKNPEREQQLMDGDRSYIITENCARDERYKKSVTESIVTLCDLCKQRDIQLL